MMKRTLLCGLLALSLLLAGCGNTQSAAEIRTTTSEEPEITLSDQLQSARPETVSYPLADEAELTALIPVDSSATDASAPVYAALETETGISVTYSCLPADSYSESLSAVLASSDMPNLIWGLSSPLLEDMEDSLLELTEYLLTSAPNYLAQVSDDQDTLDTLLAAEDGIYQFYTIQEEPLTLASFGPLIRQDLLDKYGLSLPETYADWETALLTMQDDVEQPLALTPTAYQSADYLSAGFGISLAFSSSGGFYQVDGQVKFGMMEDGFEDLIRLLSSWREQGLITSKFTDLTDISTSEYLIKQANGESGIFFLSYDRLTSLEAISELDGFAVSLLPDPVQTAGDEIHLTVSRQIVIDGAGFSISADCQDPETAVRYVDFLYSEAGILRTNYGEAGVTYTLTDGVPDFTGAALTDETLLAQYSALDISGVFCTARLELAQDQTLLESSEIWSGHRDSAYQLPTLSYDSADEVEIEVLQRDIITYATSETLLLIAGERSLDDLADIRAYLTEIGLDRCLELMQESLDEYGNMS